MAPNLSLRIRLSLLLGAVMAAGLAIGIALLILHAGSRVRAEADGATRLAHELIDTFLASRVTFSADPQAELAQILLDIRSLRHVRVFIDGASGADGRPAILRRAPQWFTALVTPESSDARIDLDKRGYGALRGVLVVASDPADEIFEIWQEIVSLALGGALVAIFAFVLVSIAVSKTLRPVSALANGLARLERGDHAVRIAAGGPPEFVAIADRINALAATLERLDAENHRLVQRIIHVQDEERRDIARDLHDEIGPFLFTIRAGIGALARKAEGAALDGARVAADCRRIDDQLAALQQVNRRILGRLRPAALEEMGLSGALEALAQGWRDARPDVDIRLSASGIGDGIDETTALTAYRITQEGLTNVFRHSGATSVVVAVTRAPNAERQELRIEVRDNGAGLDPEAREGIGLLGMSERVAALGGRLSLAASAPTGATLEAHLPFDSGKGRD